MNELFNDYIKDLQTYIMVRIAQETQELTPELEKKGRKPIFLSIGAPVQDPPEFVIEKLVECLHDKKIHTYAATKGEAFLLDAIAIRMKNRFNVELDSKKEICGLIGSKEGLANFIRAIINPTLNEKDKDIILVPDPGYASYLQMIKVSGGKGYSLPMNFENNFMPDFEKEMENFKKEGLNEAKIKALI